MGPKSRSEADSSVKLLIDSDEGSPRAPGIQPFVAVSFPGIVPIRFVPMELRKESPVLKDQRTTFESVIFID